MIGVEDLFPKFAHTPMSRCKMLPICPLNVINAAKFRWMDSFQNIRVVGFLEAMMWSLVPVL